MTITNSVTIEQLFQENQSRLQLEWIAGLNGAQKALKGDKLTQPSNSLIGHMNLIHTFYVQVLGIAESNYLFSFSDDQRRSILDKIFAADSLSMIVVAHDRKILPMLSLYCDKHEIPLLFSARHSPYVVDVLRLYLLRALAEYKTIHGVFLDVLEMGVLITGASAIGKSELALELISRGNGLVADDVVELHRISPDTLEGRCPELLRDFLEVRGIGVLNIRSIFGEMAIRPHKLLRLIVHLEDHNHETIDKIDRMPAEASYETILDVPIRKVTIPVAAGRNLAVLVEAAVRNFVMSQRGIDSTQQFIERQRDMIQELSS
ncbi:MAG: HPr(Ser) kinase/phosphatase [Burkholderiales bacterium]|jgi:HPr kinase/phosphorylase|nr:HPr(Ser) kinase/phosphatase [Burkholderiales bacterium]